MKIPVPSLARNGTTNWPTKCVNETIKICGYKAKIELVSKVTNFKLKPKYTETWPAQTISKKICELMRQFQVFTKTIAVKPNFLIDDGSTQNLQGH